MRRSLFDRLFFIPHHYRMVTREIWRALADYQLKLTRTKVQIPPEVDQTKYTQDLSKLNFHHTKFLDSFMMQYFSSKPIEGLVHGEQMMLVSGPDRIGKSTFIKHCLEKFRESKKGKNIVTPLSSYDSLPEKVYHTQEIRSTPDCNTETLLIEIDFQNRKNLTFHAFIDCIQREITGSIFKTIDTFTKAKKTLITQRILLKLVLQQVHPSFLRIYAKDTLISMLEELDPQDPLQGKLRKSKVFKSANSDTINEEQLLKEFSQVIGFLRENRTESVLESTINFYLQVLKQVQYEYRPPSYSNSYYRTGIETTSFLLSILDYFVGVTELNKDQVFMRPKNSKKTNQFFPEGETTFFHKTDMDLIDGAEDVPDTLLNRKSVLKPFPIPTTCIQSGEHIDTVLAFINMFEITCSDDQEFLDWYDALIIRSTNISGLRKGVPIVIELHPRTRVQDIFHQGSLPPDNPLIIDLAGYRIYKQKENMFKYDMQTYQFFKIWYALGHHPEMWKDAIIQLEQKGKFLNDAAKEIKNLETTKRDMIVAQGLFNRVFTNPKSIEIMHLPEFRYQLINLLNVMKKNKVIDITPAHTRIKYLDNNTVMKILVESGLLHEAYYEALITSTRATYSLAIPTIISQLKRNHGLSFALWYLRHGHYFADFNVRYKYELVVFFTTIKPKYSVKDFYLGIPYVVMQNKVSQQAYTPEEDINALYADSSRLFYNR